MPLHLQCLSSSSPLFKIILNQPKTSLASLRSSYYVRSLQNFPALLSDEAHLYFIFTPNLLLRSRKPAVLTWFMSMNKCMFTENPKHMASCSVRLSGGCKERGPQRGHHPVVEIWWLLNNRDKGQTNAQRMRWRSQSCPHFMTVSFDNEKALTFFCIHFLTHFDFLQGNFSS